MRIYPSTRGPDIWIISNPRLQKMVKSSSKELWRDLGHDFYWLDSRLHVWILLTIDSKAVGIL